MEKQEKEDRKNVGCGVGRKEREICRYIIYIYIYINMVTRTYWVVHDTHHVMRSNKETRRRKKGKKRNKNPPLFFVVRVGSTGGPSDAIYMAAPQRKNIDVRF